jgi:hypothetical protein
LYEKQLAANDPSSLVIDLLVALTLVDLPQTYLHVGASLAKLYSRKVRLPDSGIARSGAAALTRRPFLSKMYTRLLRQGVVAHLE